MIKTGSDFSGVGAFEQALIRLGIEHETVFSCDMDKYARQTYILNFGEPKYYPENVYDRAIPSDPLDIYMSSPPCQAFSLAGKRQGEADKRGILFYNTHEFIAKNRPRYFIIENVKGLLSDDGGKTFQRWLDLLGGCSINGKSIMFPNPESVPYHIHYQVLNAKHYGVPQNRERVFIVGIREDIGCGYSFPKKVPLVKRLRDVLESEVDEKYYLSDEAMACLSRGASGGYSDRMAYLNKEDKDYAGAITANHSKGVPYNMLEIKANTKQGYEIATAEDSINFSVPNSKTRRGRVGKGVAQTLDTACNQGVMVVGNIYESGHNAGDIFDADGIVGAVTCSGTRPSVKNVAPKVISQSRIRRLAPVEVFRLMDFEPSFIERTINSGLISDTQMYKQAGNSIVVACLVGIIKNLIK